MKQNVSHNYRSSATKTSLKLLKIGQHNCYKHRYLLGDDAIVVVIIEQLPQKVFFKERLVSLLSSYLTSSITKLDQVNIRNLTVSPFPKTQLRRIFQQAEASTAAVGK